MDNIGERIRYLRKKNNLTQEKLSDLLGVTYQSVSKWECGTTMPDISMIVPLARILNVSTDELFGMNSDENNKRKNYFDNEYFQFWKKDHERDIDISRQAVAEYPSEYRYHYWLACNEWYSGYSDKYEGTEIEKELISNSICHFKTVIENCTDEELRNRAIIGIVQSYKSLNNYKEAKRYAEQFPNETETCKDDVLMLCLQGKELELLYKKRIKKALLKLCSALSQLWYYEDLHYCEDALNTEESIIRNLISDGNYQHFHINLSMIYEEKAKAAMKKCDYDGALKALKTAEKHAVLFDEMNSKGIEKYTCSILDGYTEDHRKDRKDDDWNMTDSVKAYAEQNIFDAIRKRDDFKAIFS